MNDADKDAATPATGRTYRGEDPESRVLRRRAALIESGLHLFGTRGYRATSVKEVCGQAGLTERYFYESFANRESLLAAVYDHLVAELDVRLREALTKHHEEPDHRVRTVVEVFLQFMRDERHARLMLVEVSGISADITRRYQTAIRNLARLLEHPGLGLFADDPESSPRKRMTSIGLVGAISQISTQWMLEDFRTSYEDVEASVLRIFRALASSKQ